MSDPHAKIVQLIIRQRPTTHPDLEGLLRTLQAEHSLDSYTARQRLIGAGLAMFGQGSVETLGKMATLLQTYGFACWLITPRPPAFDPDLLRSLDIQPEKILLTCRKGTVSLERGTPVVGVLADLSGGLADKHVKRLLAQNTYRGSHAPRVLSHDEMIRSILQGQPVFDFYLLDRQGEVTQAVQVQPGRFNIEGLGSRASLSATRNLQAMMTLVEDYAGDFRLHCDFGLSQLPGCMVQRAADNPAAAVENLASLTRYGWLVSQLQGEGRPAGPVGPAGQVAEAAAAGTATAVIGPLMGVTAAGQDPVGMPGIDVMAREASRVIAADAAKTARTEDRPPVSKDLPPPPDRPPARFSWKQPLGMLGGVAAGLTIALGSHGDEVFRLMMRHGLAAGVVPALVALALFWSGFYFIRLKRQIEDTPTSKVRSMATGLVEVHGRACRQYALVAPMTQSACAWYRLRKYRKNNNKNWKLVKQVDSSHVPFLIDDGTGRVAVAPMGASVRARVQQTGYPGQSPLTFTRFGSGTEEDEKWVEEIIYEGTSLYVLGFARPTRRERVSLRERTLARLRQLKLDPVAMRRYDTDGDGHINEVEWQVARTDAEQESLREHLAAGQGRKRQEEHLVIGRAPQRGLPFIVAEALSEAHLSRKYGWISVPLLLGGVGAMALALYLLRQSLGG